MGTLLLCGPPRSATVCFVTLKRSVVRLIAETVTVVMRDSATATRSPREHGSRLRPRRGGDPHLCQLYLHHVAVTWICAWGMMPARQSQENTLTYDLYPAEKQDTFPHLGRAVNYSVQYEQIRSILFHETTRARVKVIREGRAQGKKRKGKGRESLTMFAFLGIHFHPKGYKSSTRKTERGYYGQSTIHSSAGSSSKEGITFL